MRYALNAKHRSKLSGERPLTIIVSVKINVSLTGQTCCRAVAQRPTGRTYKVRRKCYLRTDGAQERADVDDFAGRHPGT